MEKFVIEDTPVRIEMTKGEVRKFEIDFRRTNNLSHHLWGNIVSGEFYQPAPSIIKGRQQLSLYRAVYKKKRKSSAGQDNADFDILYVTIDCRSSFPPAFCGIDPNFNNIISVDVVEPNKMKECILSIDLGNTRTVALLIDKVDDMQRVVEDSSGINIYPVPFRWAENPKDYPIVGSFESIISLVNSSKNANSWSFDDCRFSFVKLGDFAVWNNLACKRFSETGRYSLSSPKRYYWDQDPSDMEWIAARYSMSENSDSVSVEKLEGIFAKAFAKNVNCTASKLPPASLLGAMVAEIYEQACFYIASKEFKTKTDDARIRRITDIHITYPSTLSPSEKNLYKTQLQNGLNTYLELCPNSPSQVSLHSDIDEATAVLALYVFSEIRNYASAKFWLQTIGRHKAGGNAARVAVIDIGGGTTDLSVSEVFALDSSAADEPLKASINLIFRDGVNSAGDNLILNFIKSCVSDLGLQALLNETRIPQTKLNRIGLKEIYNNQANSNLIRGLKRSFWFELAITIASRCDEILRVYGENEWDEQTVAPVTYRVSDEALNAWKTLLSAEGYNITLGPKTLFTFKLTKEIIQKYKDAVRLTFEKVAKSFGRSICAYDSDIVLFSGKTAEFYYIRAFFQDYLPLSPMSIKPMQNFHVGDWCGEITDIDGRINDSKISTALGGALYTLREKAFVTMDFSLDLLAANPNCKWGIVNRDRIAFTDPLFPNGEMQHTIKFSNVSRFVARQNELATTAILSYEIRLTPIAHALHPEGIAPGATVTLERDTRSMELRLVSTSGFYNDGNALVLSDIQCRICNLGNTFGLDNDRI